MGRAVVVETQEGKRFSEQLLAIDERLNLVLDKVVAAGEGTFKIVVDGGEVKEVRPTEKPFDFKTLADGFSRVFPNLVRMRDAVGAIILTEKVKRLPVTK